MLEKQRDDKKGWKLAEIDGGSQRDRRKLWRRRATLWCRNTIVAVLVLTGLASLALRAYALIKGPPLGFQLCYCGNSTDEAIANGCKFDLLGPSWAPDHCRDDELTAEFMKAGKGPNGTWEFWWDHEHTKPMSIAEVSLLPDDPNGAFYSTWEFHVKHCTYQWRKHTRGLEKGITNMDIENVGLGHIQHCEGVILRQLPMRAKIPLNVPYVGWKFVPDNGDHLHTGPDKHMHEDRDLQ